MAWFALTNRKTSSQPTRSPERTRPRLLPESPAPHGADGSPAAADEAPPAPPSADRRYGDLRPDRSGAPSCESTAPSARTPATAPPACDPHGREPPSAGETLKGRASRLCASWTSFLPKDEVSTKPG